MASINQRHKLHCYAFAALLSFPFSLFAELLVVAGANNPSISLSKNQVSDVFLGKVATNAKVKETKKCLFPKSMKRAPTWVCNAHYNGSMVTAVGMASKSGAGIPFMEQMAAADARAHLAKDLRGAAQNKIKGSKKSANKDTVYRDSALIIQITDDSLQGTKILKSTYSPDGTLYVLVGLDKTIAKKLIKSLSAGYLEQRRK